ncbi:hypothetical protein K7X08_024616 [Anisodus acutangulus]|uniref:Uncharacterized protein n=1 Tax=Anisodus acutangulus TaxID=402998 RepID=A0A9Q1M962_9SOLA|nr:hypothetical protein K7X08_024616 [Anisodus acutangulus]
MYWRSRCPSIEQPYSDRSAEDYIAHMIIKEERVICEEQGNMYGNRYNYNFPSGYHHGYCAREAHKKVHFVEPDQTTEFRRNGKYEVTEEKVDNHKSNMNGNRYKYNFPSGYRAPEAQKKAHFLECDKTTEVCKNGKQEVTEEKIDNEADSFIKRKHKNFELAKMDTFKVY